MIKPIKTKRHMSGVYMILELTLLLCATLFVYNQVDWKDIGVDFQALIENFDCNCAANLNTGGNI